MYGAQSGECVFAEWQTGKVAEWSVCWTRNQVLLGLSPTLATCWICSRLSQVQILCHA